MIAFPNRFRSLTAACAAAIAGVVCTAHPAQAGDLADIIYDLYPFKGPGIHLVPNLDNPAFSHEAHFTSMSLESFQQLNTALVSNLGFVSPNAVSTNYTFDIETGLPQRTTDNLGPILAESASTIGRNKLNIGFSYSRAEFTSYNGQDLDSLQFRFAHPEGVLDFVNDVVVVDLNVEIRQEIFAIFANYGITDRWDVGIVVPIVQMKATAEAFAHVEDPTPDIFPNVHQFDNYLGDGQIADSNYSKTGGYAVGIGDIILRTKYTLARDEANLPDIAVGGWVILPTGDEDDLLGTGELRLIPQLIVSDQFGLLAPHLNIGYEWAPGDSKLNSLRYVVGTEFLIHERITPSIDFLGRYSPVGDRQGEHLVDFAVGARAVIVDDWIFSGYMMTPVNRDEGLRAALVFGVGIETTF
jgi:hypothetical protein